MGTRDAIVKDAAVGDQEAVIAAIGTNNGVYKGLQNNDVLGEFPTDALGAALQTHLAISATEDFEVEAVTVLDDTIDVITDIAAGIELRFSSTGELPAPLVAGAVYYAIRISPVQIKVAETPALATAGTPIDLTTQGTGTHTLDIGLGYTNIVWDLIALYRQQGRM